MKLYLFNSTLSQTETCNIMEIMCVSVIEPMSPQTLQFPLLFILYSQKLLNNHLILISILFINNVSIKV